jgi:aminoglycoside N3'-acetyltransferase
MFESKDIIDILSTLGVRRGDILYLHVTFGQMKEFKSSPVELIAALRELVGDEGTLLAPAYPARAAMLIEYIGSNHVFDARRTPTKMGIFQEIFRRTRGALRSLHPWATTSAIGLYAERLLNEHHLHPDAFSPMSPYLKMRDMGGKIVGIGADINISTYIHVMDSLLQEHYPMPVYIHPPARARVIDWDGNEITAPALMIRQEIVTCIYPIEMKPYLLDRGVLKQSRAGDSVIYAMGIPEYIETATEIAMEQMSRGEPPCWLRKFCEKYNVEWPAPRGA